MHVARFVIECEKNNEAYDIHMHDVFTKLFEEIC